MTTRTIWLGLAAACVAALIGRTVTATSPAAHEGETYDRARTFLIMRLTEELKLVDATALAVAKVVRTVDDKRLSLRSRRQQVETKIGALLDSNPGDGAALESLVNDANGIDHELALIGEEMGGAIQKFLTVEERARLVLLKPRLQREVRQQRLAAGE